MTPKQAIVAEFERLGWLTTPESTGHAYVNMVEANALAAAVVGALMDHGYEIVGPTSATEYRVSITDCRFWPDSV